MRQWRSCADLLDLFAVPDSEGRRRFEDLSDMGALLRRFADWWKLGDLERCMMKEEHLSPLLFWSCIKRAVRPLLSVGGDTLRALGVPVEGDPSTAHDLALAVVTVLAEDLTEADKELSNQLQQRLEEVLIRGNQTR